MGLAAIAERYKKADLRLRALLFGDSPYSHGWLRGDEPRQQAAGELRRMRAAFEDVVEEASDETSLADDLRADASSAVRESREQQ